MARSEPRSSGASQDDDGGAWIVTALATLVAFGVLAACFLRLSYGVDFTDESYYVGMSYNFALGGAPFKDELCPHQGAALLVTPLVRLWLHFEGSSAGLVGFLRRVHFAGTLLTAAAVALRARRHRPATALGLVGGTLVVTFVFCGIASPSYNTIGCNALVAGLLLVSLAPESQRPALLLASGTAVLSLGAFAYPTLAIPSGVMLGGTAWLLVRRRTPGYGRALASAACVGGLATALVISLLLGTDPEDRARVRTYVLASQPRDFLHGAASVARDIASLWRAGLVLVCLGALALRGPRVLGRAWPAAFGVVAVACSVLLRESDRLPSGGVLVTVAPVLALPALLMHRTDDHALTLVWATSLLAGAVSSLTSTNGAANACLGLLPGGVAAVLLLADASAALPGPERRGSRSLLLATIVAIAVIQVFNQYGYVYRDDPLETLDARIDAGPWRGLRTTERRRRLVEDLARDLGAVARAPDASLISFGDFPAGYLFTTLRPSGLTAWALPEDPQRKERPHLRRWWATLWPDVVLSFHPNGAPPDTLGETFLGRGYRPVVVRSDYTLYRSPRR